MSRAPKNFEVAFLGPVGSGKSHLLSALDTRKQTSTEEITPRTTPTIGVDYHFVQTKSGKIKIHDLGGEDRFESIRKSFINDKRNLFVIVVDNSNLTESKANLDKFFAEIDAAFPDKNMRPPVGVVVNVRSSSQAVASQNIVTKSGDNDLNAPFIQEDDALYDESSEISRDEREAIKSIEFALGLRDHAPYSFSVIGDVNQKEIQDEIKKKMQNAFEKNAQSKNEFEKIKQCAEELDAINEKIPLEAPLTRAMISVLYEKLWRMAGKFENNHRGYRGSAICEDELRDMKNGLVALKTIDDRVSKQDYFEEQKKLIENAGKKPSDDNATQAAFVGDLETLHTTPNDFFSNPMISLSEMDKKISDYLDRYRKLHGVAQQNDYAQERFDNRDIDAIVAASEKVKEYEPISITVDNNTFSVRYNLDEENALTIIHDATDIIPSASAVKNDADDNKAKENAVTHLEKITTALKDRLASDRKTVGTTTHLVPEVSSGRARDWKVGSQELQENSRHICLRVVTQNAGQNLKDVYETQAKVFDPRGTRSFSPFAESRYGQVGLGVQNLGDDTNCGRYVAAMTIQAAGLAKDGLPMTAKNLKVSPAVERALHFNSVEDAQIGLRSAYVKPLSKDAGPEEIIKHNIQKMQCLRCEYESRKGNINRAFHGTKATPFGGGYGKATFFTTKVASSLGFAYSAEEKFKAVTQLLHLCKITSQNTEAVFDKSALPKAARQGELGKCLDAIVEAQKQLADKSSRIRPR